MFVVSPEKIVSSNDRTSERPSNNPSQNSIILQPNGLATPIPVTTTRSISTLQLIETTLDESV